MRTGKIQIRNCRLGPRVFKFQPNVGAVIDVKTDIDHATQDLVAPSFRNPRGNTKVRVQARFKIILWSMWQCFAHCPLSGCAAPVTSARGVTLLPAPGFLHLGYSFALASLSYHGSRVRHSSDGRRSQSCEEKIVHMAHCVTTSASGLHTS